MSILQYVRPPVPGIAEVVADVAVDGATSGGTGS